ncbi:hypothetical protein BKA67DRAFT_541893 [Truncatella angustata]|uniref:Uncharacterized protein n=1 Tax=Truncatella angustata TaxID=152316 RepID=A0A9P8UB96_9PEZI|nr:uncharacterized protein BKA67DRAFT_541893 [Truncatella angustata]KAH6645737.1 hypothetical protein BKA67DRAFT_541893 [Truncatella angustata]
MWKEDGGETSVEWHWRNTSLRTGITIPTSEIRLITSSKDLYRWEWLPEAKEIFTKHLSEHSTGAYRKIFEGIGQTFEAVLSEDHGSDERVNKTETTSFTVQIEQLENRIHCLENIIQERDIDLMKHKANQGKLKADLDSMRDKYRIQEQEIQSWMKRAEDAEQIANRYSEEVSKMLPVFQNLQNSTVAGDSSHLRD